MKIGRRQFVERTAGAVLAAGALGVIPRPSTKAAAAPAPSDGPALPIVDTHQHLWDLAKVRPPWLKSAGHLNRNHVMSDYLEAAQGLGIVKTVYMEVAVADDDLLKEAQYVVELCRRKDNPMVAAVIGGRAAAADFKAYITQFKGSPFVKGIRCGLPERHGEMSSGNAFVKGVQLLGELGMSFDLCPPPQGLSDAVKLVDACPGTRFVLDHCGNADPAAFATRPSGKSGPPSHDPGQWRRDMAALAKRERVVCKISGIVARLDKDNWKPDDLAPVINHCLEVFGPDRVMFASDWPVCTRAASLRQWVEALKQIVAPRSREEQRKLFHDNAVRFYGIEG